jgi:trimeric autotransporter adhesin
MRSALLSDGGSGVHRRQFLRRVSLLGAAAVGVTALNPSDALAFELKELETKLHEIGAAATKYNIAIGSESAAITTGEHNLALGGKALSLAGAKSLANVAIGLEALERNASGGSNVAVGAGAGKNAIGSGNVFIGYQAGANEETSDKLYIANSDTAEPLIGGSFETPKTVTIHGALSVTGTVSGSNLQSAEVRSLPGGSTGVGTNALNALSGAPTVEQEKHHGNTALGDGALEHFTGVIKKSRPTSGTEKGAKVFHLTNAKAEGWVTNNVPNVTFTEVTPGVTGVATGLPYWVVNATETGFELVQAGGYPETRAKVEEKAAKGEVVVVGGVKLEAATTEMVLSASGEDNTVIGTSAGASLTYGGGNILIGERAGANLTTGEENLAIGVEALVSQTTGSSNTAIGFGTLYSNTSGSQLLAIGWSALTNNTTGSDNVAIGGYGAMEANTTGSKNVAVGSYSMWKATTAENSAAFGMSSLQELTTGGENTALGAYAGSRLTTGQGNTLLGAEAGQLVTGSGNVFVGSKAGSSLTATSNTLIIANNSTRALIEGTMSETASSQKLGFFGVTPVTQPAKPEASSKAIIEVLEKLGLCA